MAKTKTIRTSSEKNTATSPLSIKPLPAFEEKIKTGTPQDAITSEPQEAKKRHRRTRVEIEAERAISDTPDDATGYEIIVDLLKAQSDMDVKKYGLPPCDKAIFDPFAQNTMKLANYFIGRYAKAWHYILGITLFQGYTLLSTRRTLIDQYSKKNLTKEKQTETVIPAADKKQPIITLSVPDNRRPEDRPK